MSKVINLHDHTDDGRTWDLEQMLQDALHDVRAGGRRSKKALILFLDETSGEYAVGFSQCGMTMPECVLLCEMGKDRFKQEFMDWGED
jgi:hypothetical protein